MLTSSTHASSLLGCRHRVRGRLSTCGLASLIALTAFGCTGSLGPSDETGAGSGNPGSGRGSGSPGDGPGQPGQNAGDDPAAPWRPAGDGDTAQPVSDFGDQTGGSLGAEAPPIVPAPAPRVVRLTRAQWQNSVIDLLGVNSVDASGLRDDPRQGGFRFDNDGAALVVDDALWAGYQSTAETLAAQVSGDDKLVERLAPPDADAANRRDLFLASFLLRAHRRPVGDMTLTAYRQLFDGGAAAYPNMPAFEAGLRTVVEAALQSPWFVYRIELSEDVMGERISLDGYEVASRLSYFVWNTMPDQALMSAAENGALSGTDGVRAQVQRLLADPRASTTVESFHSQLFETHKLEGINPSDREYSVSDSFGAHAAEEQRRFVTHVYETDGSLATLLTSNETFVNAELASVYGLSGNYGESFQLATLDESERAGFLTQVGFLAANATSVDPDPIHRGKFVAERIACKHITAPPTNVPPPPQVADQTNRDRIADYTEMPGTACAGCHATIINPFGFPFESYDAIGAFRTTDRGFPVDATARPRLDAEPTDVQDGVDLAHKLAASPEVHHCYVKHWLEFAHGRHRHANDEGQLQALLHRSLEDDASLVTLLTELVTSDAFLFRSVEEAP